jgi:hypothetical protein
MVVATVYNDDDRPLGSITRDGRLVYVQPTTGG